MDVNCFAVRFRVTRIKGGNCLSTLQGLNSSLIISMDGSNFTQQAGLNVIRNALRFNGSFARRVRVRFGGLRIDNYCLLFINMLLFGLFRFGTKDVMTRFNLTRLINHANSGTIRVLFVTGFRFRPNGFRFQRFSLRHRVTRFNLTIRFYLVRLVAFRFFFIRRLFVINFHALRIRFRSKHACVCAVATFSVRLRSTNVSQ